MLWLDININYDFTIITVNFAFFEIFNFGTVTPAQSQSCTILTSNT